MHYASPRLIMWRGLCCSSGYFFLFFVVVVVAVAAAQITRMRLSAMVRERRVRCMRGHATVHVFISV
uniref:Putative secreted protein n=1 Tax=Anopheles darlingi TaxID=43151 RepID=A0A2M4D0P0_ANODA